MVNLKRTATGILVGFVCLLFVTVLPQLGFADGPSLDSPAGPADSASAMHTLEDVYNRLNDGTAGQKRTGAFTEPQSGPAATGHTVDQIMEKAPAADNTNGAAPSNVSSGKTYWGLRTDGTWGPQTGTGSALSYPAPVEKTGQTTCYDQSGNSISCTGTGQDGEYQKGVAWPSPRFTDNGDGTVTDNITGLIWLKNANCFGTKTWSEALSAANSLENGQCDLSDGSAAGDWRLPNVKELQSLINFGMYNPALPSGHPFSGVQSYYYWSASTGVNNTDYAWFVYLSYGNVGNVNFKSSNYYVWPVRGGQGN